MVGAAESCPSPSQSPSLEWCSTSVALSLHGHFPQPAGRQPSPPRRAAERGDRSGAGRPAAPMGGGEAGRSGRAAARVRRCGGRVAVPHGAGSRPLARCLPRCGSPPPAPVIPLSAPLLGAGERSRDVLPPQRQGVLLAVQLAHGGGVPGAPRGSRLSGPFASLASPRDCLSGGPFLPFSPVGSPCPGRRRSKAAPASQGHLPFKSCPAFALRQAPPSPSPSSPAGCLPGKSLD